MEPDDDVDEPQRRRFTNPPCMLFDGEEGRAGIHAKNPEVDNILSRVTGIHEAHHLDINALDQEVSRLGFRLQHANRHRILSKQASQITSGTNGSKGGRRPLLQSWWGPLIFGLASVAMLTIVIAWSKGDLHHDLGMAHVLSLRTRLGFLKSPLYSATAWPGTVIELHGHRSDVFDVRMVTMAPNALKRRVLTPPPAGSNASEAIESRIQRSAGTLWYELRADGKVFHKQSVELYADRERENFETVQVKELLGYNGHHFQLHAWAETDDGEAISFLCQVLQMGPIAKYRLVLGGVTFAATFALIISEVIHRVYSAFFGSMVMHVLIASIQETPHLHELAAMIDYGTLMLLFSMMVLMHILSLTGFFEWFTIFLVKLSRRNPVALFFLLSNAAGVLSAFLDNVTVTLLTGPLVFSLAEVTGLRSMPVYLAITIAASIGGTATMIGDPPNIVIESKMKVGFVSFLVYNGPLTMIILPLSTVIMYFQFRDVLVDKAALDEDGKFNVNLEELEQENAITDRDTFAGVVSILIGVLLALLTTPLHHVEPAWFTVIGMFIAATKYHSHHLEELLLSVEWDTLLFFAVLFVLVESLQELGVIREFGDYLVDALLGVPESSRMLCALALFLWVSALGSAFLESLPYTSTIISLLLDLQGRSIPGMRVKPLTWSLSVGACVGGIGSIMGSSTNLTAVAISERYGKQPEDKVLGSHFLRYGFPLLVLLTTIAMFYHWFVFLVLEAEG